MANPKWVPYVAKPKGSAAADGKDAGGKVPDIESLACEHSIFGSDLELELDADLDAVLDTENLAELNKLFEADNGEVNDADVHNTESLASMHGRHEWRKCCK